MIGLTSDGGLLRFRSDRPGDAGQIGWVTGLRAGGRAADRHRFPRAGRLALRRRERRWRLHDQHEHWRCYLRERAQRWRQSVALSGTSFGVDFNPSADRLRIVSDTGQNLRHNVNAGGVTIDDSQGGLTPLTYTAPPAAPIAALGVTGSAYTNNDLAPATESTATTLFDIDATMDQVVIQSPPNNGILNATGKIGVDVDPAAVGFDIYSRLVDGVTVSNRAFASFLVGGVSTFHQIDLLTGAATPVGMFEQPVVDIAVRLDQ